MRRSRRGRLKASGTRLHQATQARYSSLGLALSSGRKSATSRPIRVVESCGSFVRALFNTKPPYSLIENSRYFLKYSTYLSLVGCYITKGSSTIPCLLVPPPRGVSLFSLPFSSISPFSLAHSTLLTCLHHLSKV